MPFKVSNMKKTWLRLYSTLSRRPHFIRNNLVMGPRRPSTIGRTLWGYFNAPGNVMFVTTNVVSFAALVTYNTLVNVPSDRILQQEMLSAQLLSTSPAGQAITFNEDEQIDNIPTPISMFQPLEENTSFGEIKDTIVKQIHERITPQRQALNDEISEVVDTPFTTYLDGNVELMKHVPVNSTNSLIAKFSLFSLFYSYHLYSDVVISQDSKKDYNEQITEETQSRSHIWTKEIQRLQKLSFPILKSLRNEKNSSLTIFYRIWNEANRKKIEKYDTLYQFKFPRWSLFPNSLSRLCNELHDNKFETLGDFQRLYELTDRTSLRKLFRMWLYDYSNLLNRTNNNVMNEAMFNKLIKDSFNDIDLDSFGKFSSIVLKPEDKRRRLFFAIRPDYQSYQIHLDTLLTIFQNYVLLQKRKLESLHHLQGHDMEILRMVQLIKNNGYLGKNGVAYILLRQDCPSFSESSRKRYFRNLSDNKRLGKLLQEVAILQNVASDS
ncbi:hypothetical protein RI543_003886 [Arxiozyma heterogenica]|uniref:Uncharacterized protein n=1 Tax=Arxiozyma heterogenica TaxID=278026 RepID=A0AAN7WLU3_9SACH|nr:hypothetical protein RI543_003886 [Kazachstania heterogenica]